jgi:hypothetical protein
MIEDRTLTIRETKNIIKQLENELELYLEKKQINFEKTQPSCTKLKDIIVNKGNTIFDSFTTYMIKDEECDDRIYELKGKILAYEKYLNNELDRMREYDDIPLIIYLKEERQWNWRDIDKYLNLGEDYSRTKYKRFKKLG